jgi:hypothetical protein
MIVAKKPGPIWRSLGTFHSSPTDEIEVEVPPSVQVWTIFARSIDVNGHPNSIQEGGGNPTPSDTLTVGDAEGKLDLGKALEASLGSSLAIAAQVLGVSTGGITEDLIGQFAVSKQKLANAPIIDAVRIEDLAVGTAHLQLASVNTAIIQDGVIVNGHFGDAEIYGAKIKNAAIVSAHINDVSADKLTAGTADVGAGGLYIEGGGGITIKAGGKVITQSGVYITAGGYISTTDYLIGYLGVKVGSGGSITAIDSTGKFVGSGGVVTPAAVDGQSLKIQGNEVLSSGRYADFLRLSINGTIRIDTSGNVSSANGASGTTPLAKITPGGADGSLTFVNGICTSITDAT